MPCCSNPNPKREEEKSQAGGCCSKPKPVEPAHTHAHSGGCCSKPTPQENTQSSSGGCCSKPSPKGESIHPQMTIESILGMFPNKAQKLAQEITNAGLQCIGCHAAVWETLEAGMLKHGKSLDQVQTLVNRLNALLNEPVNDNTISLTARGAAKFLEILAEEDKQGWGMRFSEELAGCNGFEYVLDFSEKAEVDDEIFVCHGVEVHVKKALVPRLIGSEIDYFEGLRGAGFKVSNPNVSSSCGCGSSHNY